MEARAITEALGGRWCGAYGVARCPSHPDRSPSLKVSDDPRKTDGVDVHCFAGCAWEDVKVELARLGLLPDFRCRNPQLLTSLLSKITTTESDDGSAATRHKYLAHGQAATRNTWREVFRQDTRPRYSEARRSLSRAALACRSARGHCWHVRSDHRRGRRRASYLH